MKKPGISRRRLMHSGLSALVVGAGVGAAVLARPEKAAAAPFVRPPGALPEEAFGSACIRCGLCVQACPYDTLRLFGHEGAPRNSGTPYFVAREVPCEMCPDIPCVAACPTGALDPMLDDIRDARMGLAALTHPQLCNSYTGAAYCHACVDACPLGTEAIRMQPGATPMGGMFTPTVDPATCTGCGKCEQACIATPAAIRVIPSHA